MHVTHPFLNPGTVEFRGYQANLARSALRRDTLVVLPTGMGKTIVAVLAIADALQAGSQRVLVLAPTRPLVDQHGATLKALLAPPWGERVRCVTGFDEPERRGRWYQEPGITVATPQVVQNDLVSGRLDPATLDWVVFDEAHRAVGDYPYVFIGRELRRRSKARVLALTASPGHDARKVQEVRDHLGIVDVEIRTPADPDIAPFVQTVAAEYETLPLPPALARVSQRLQDALAERIRALKGLGFLKDKGTRPTRRDLLQLAGQLQGLIQKTPDPDASLFSGLSLQAQAIKLQHAIELAQTQGAQAFIAYLDGVRQEAGSGHASKATHAVLADARVNEAYHIARLDESENPKMGRTSALVQEQLERDADARVIVFTHFRTTCENVVAALGKVPGARPVLFVGQQRKGDQEGLSQKKQAQVLDGFRAGTSNVLVATSVAEEGLDIPETDLVVFYEPIPSEIRAIQRRGRTGRKRAGRVVVLITKGTQDEAAHWVSRRREQEMVRELASLRSSVARNPAPPGGAPTPLAAASAAGVTSAQSQLAPALALASTPAPDTHAALQDTAGSASATAVGLAAGALGASDARPPVQATLEAAPRRETRNDEVLGTPPRIICDHREQAGGVTRHLHEMGAVLEFRQLEVGDFVLSDRVVAERKACRDFVDALLDGRLFDQLRAMQGYPRPLLVLEGESLAGHRNVSPQAIHAALASSAIDYGIPVLQSRDALETARLLFAVARREQTREHRKLAVRPGKPAMTDRERQLYVLCGLPGISDTLAQRLLDRFGSLDAVLRAPADDLADVSGIGEAKAGEVRRILGLAWSTRAPASSARV